MRESRCAHWLGRGWWLGKYHHGRSRSRDFQCVRVRAWVGVGGRGHIRPWCPFAVLLYITDCSIAKTDGDGRLHFWCNVCSQVERICIGSNIWKLPSVTCSSITTGFPIRSVRTYTHGHKSAVAQTITPLTSRFLNTTFRHFRQFYFPRSLVPGRVRQASSALFYLCSGIREAPGVR